MTGDVGVWDRDSRPPRNLKLLVWPGRPCHETNQSLADFTFSEASEIRSRALQLVNEELKLALSLSRDDEDELCVSTSLLTDFSPLKGALVEDLVGLIRFEQVLQIRRPRSITYYGHRMEIRECLRQICEREGVRFLAPWRASNLRFNLPRFAENAVRSFSQWGYALAFWSSRKILSTKISKGDNGGVLLVGYLYNLDSDAIKDGVFRSAQWGELPSLISEAKGRVTFAHFYTRSHATKGVLKSRRLVRRLQSGSSDSHFMFEGEIRIRDVWDGCVAISKRRELLQRLVSSSRESSLCPYVAPLMLAMWEKSLQTTWCIKYFLIFRSFSRFLRERSFSGLVFLSESQPWERALLAAWTSSQRGPSLGVIHSSILFWHLGAYQEVLFRDLARSSRWRPERTAVNGRLQASRLSEAGCSLEQVSEVEALRYVNLKGRQTDFPLGRRFGQRSTVLVVGDLADRHTSEMLGLVKGLILDHPGEFEVIFRPHPAASTFSESSVLGVRCSTGPLSETMATAGFVLVSPLSSAMLDAIVLEIPFAVYRSRYDLNSSPIYGFSEIPETETSAQLQLLIKSGYPTPWSGNFLSLNSDFCSWRELVKNFP